MKEVPVFIPSLDRLYQHMPSQDDMILIVLKGHLLIEEMLEHIIYMVVAHGERLEKAKFTFYQKVVLAQAMCWPEHGEFWDVIFAVNSLRNDLAHSLQSTQIENRVNRIIELTVTILDREGHEEQRQWINAATNYDKLRLALWFVIGFLEKYRKDTIAYRDIVDVLYNSPSQ